MKKILLISLLLMAIASSVYAKENKTAVTSEDVSVSAPEDKPEPAPPKKQGSSKQQEAVNLETAYKREYAFLEAQKRELIDRLKNYQSSANREEHALSSKINAL